jgi:hypothetical protein
MAVEISDLGLEDVGPSGQQRNLHGVGVGGGSLRGSDRDGFVVESRIYGKRD